MFAILAVIYDPEKGSYIMSHYLGSTWLRPQNFDIRLKNEPRVRIMIRRNLIGKLEVLLNPNFP